MACKRKKKGQESSKKDKCEVSFWKGRMGAALKRNNGEKKILGFDPHLLSNNLVLFFLRVGERK